MEILNSFFSNLAIRLNKEPRLSDLIWTMCSTSELFKNIFLKFCFGKDISVAGNLKREHVRNESTVDFYFRDINGKEYIIENKRYDRGDHFTQYIEEFPDAERAFIAIYIEPLHEGWFIKTWKDFIIHLENIINNKNTGTEEQKLIKSFLLYLKSVTDYKEVKTMNFSFISSLSSLYEIISKLREQFGLQWYNVPTAMTSDYYGQYFNYTNKNGKTVFIWMGLRILEESGIYIKFQTFQDEGWLPKEEQAKISKLTDGKYFDKTSIEAGNFYIHLKEEYYKKLCENIDVKEQKDILEGFLKEILDILK